MTAAPLASTKPPQLGGSGANDEEAASPIPSAISLFLITIVYLFFNCRALGVYLISPPALATSSTSGTLVWVTDGSYLLLYALPLFLASAITLASFSGSVRPVQRILNPERGVLVIQVLIAIGNVWQLIWAFYSTYVLGYELFPKAKPKLSLWTDKLEEYGFHMADSLAWNFMLIFYFAIRSPALSPLQSGLGFAHEHVVKLHRSVGWWNVFLVFTHATMILTSWIASGQLVAKFRFTAYFGAMSFFGFLGASVLLIMAVSSIPAFRRRFFTVFAMLHRLWPLFVGSAIVHIPSFAWPTIPALALYIIDRVACLWTATPGAAGAATVTTTAVRVNDDVVALLIPVGPARGSTVDSGELDNVLLHMYTPGRFLSLSYPMDAINVTHPFSIAAYSAPNRTVSVMIRAVGSWTRKLHSFATKDGAAVELRVEGPFSMPAMHVDSHWAATGSDAVTDNNLTVIAGGVGISKYLMHPTNPLLESSDSLASIQKPTASERITDTAVESSGSLSTVRKLWLCKDDTEMAMYLALGADLSDWAAFSSHGFARILEETGIHEKYPLFEQYNVSVPLQRSARLLMFLTLVAMYFGIYVVARVVPAVPNAKYCAQKPTNIDRLLSCSRVYGLYPYLATFVGMTIAVQLVTLARVSFTARSRSKGTFVCHDAIDTVPRALIERRFDADQDAPKLTAARSNGGSKPGAAVRVCAGRPVRELVRKAGGVSGIAVIDDGRLF